MRGVDISSGAQASFNKAFEALQKVRTVTYTYVATLANGATDICAQSPRLSISSKMYAGQKVPDF